METNIMENKNILTTLKQGVKKRLFALVTLITFFLQALTPAYAAVLSSGEIQDAIDSMADLEFISSGSPYQYQAAGYIDTSAVKSYPDIKNFFERLRSDFKEALHDPIPTPVAVGDITIFVPYYGMGTPVGDTYVQSRYVRDQIQQVLRRNVINAELYSNANAELGQLIQLYENAFLYAKATTTQQKFGDPIPESTFDRYTSDLDMVWPEYRTINGKSVLVPVLYLSAATIEEQTVDRHVVTINGAVNLDAIDVQNVDITFRSDFINLANDFTAQNSNIDFDSESVQVIVGGELSLLSSAFDADGQLAISAHSINARTLVQHFDLGGSTGSFYGQITSITADGYIELISQSNVVLQGVTVTSGDSIIINAGGSIYIGGKELTSSFDGQENGYSVQRNEIDYLQSSLTAAENIQLIANGYITLDAAEIVSSNGHIEILAGMGVLIENEFGQFQESKNGKFGKTTKVIDNYRTIAIRSVLDAGKGIKIESAAGDITLKAVDIKSIEGTEVSAVNGKVNMLLAVEQDQYNYNSTRKGLFTVKTVTAGHDIETAVPNTIIGGFKATAQQGVYVEYEGNSELTLTEQVDVLSELPGMEWMNSIRNDPTLDIDWNAVELSHEEWRKSNTSLSPAGMALLTIAVAIATSGAGAALLTEALAANVVYGAALSATMNAAVTTLATQAASSLATGNSPYETFKEMGTDENLTSLAVAMVTAGAIASVDSSSFFSPVNSEGIPVDLTLSQQAWQAVAHSTVNASINTTVGVINGTSDWSDFDDNLAQSLAQAGINKLGEKMANMIGEAAADPELFDKAIQYISHAGAGCVIGAASGELSGRGDPEFNCASGAGGAVIGELVADIVKSQEEYEQLDSEVKAFLEAEADNIKAAVNPSDYATEGDYYAALNNYARNSLYNNTAYQNSLSELNKLKANGADLAQLSAALGAFYAGYDVSLAGDAGRNAAENNGLLFLALPYILGLIAAAGTAWTIHDTYVGIQAIADAYKIGGDEGDEAVAEAVEDFVKGLALDVALTFTGTKMVSKLGPVIEELQRIGEFGKAQEILAMSQALDNGGSYTQNRDRISISATQSSNLSSIEIDTEVDKYFEKFPSTTLSQEEVAYRLSDEGGEVISLTTGRLIKLNTGGRPITIHANTKPGSEFDISRNDLSYDKISMDVRVNGEPTSMTFDELNEARSQANLDYEAATRSGNVADMERTMQNKNNLSEALGEASAQAWVNKNYDDFEISPLSSSLPGNGQAGQFDQVYMLTDSMGNQKLLIVEAKGGINPQLGGRNISDTDRVQQGTSDYIDSIVANMQKKITTGYSEAGSNTGDLDSLQNTVNLIESFKKSINLVEYAVVKQKVGTNGNASDSVVGNFFDIYGGS